MDVKIEIGDKVTLTPAAITKRDFASIGVDEDTEFTVTGLGFNPDPAESTKVILADEKGLDYIVSINDLIWV